MNKGNHLGLATMLFTGNRTLPNINSDCPKLEFEEKDFICFENLAPADLAMYHF